MILCSITVTGAIDKFKYISISFKHKLREYIKHIRDYKVLLDCYDYMAQNYEERRY